jgi:hypothetical protein
MLLSQYNSGMRHYMFWAIAAIIMYITLSESRLCIPAILPYKSQCLHAGSSLYIYTVYVMPLR